MTHAPHGSWLTCHMVHDCCDSYPSCVRWVADHAVVRLPGPVSSPATNICCPLSRAGTWRMRQPDVAHKGIEQRGHATTAVAARRRSGADPR